MSALTRRRALRAAAPVAGLLAAGLLVWQGSTAAFTATSSNTTNSWAAGTLSLTNNGGTLASGAYVQTTTPGLFGEVGLRPGSTGVKCLTVEKGGTVVGSDLRFYVPTFTDSTPAGFASFLKLTIDAAPVAAATNVLANCTGFPGASTSVATNVALDALPANYAAATSAATLAAGTQRVAFRFAWSFDTTAPNSLQGKTITATTLGFEVQ